jgi:hypothetical protein
VTDDEIRDAAKILRQRMSSKGMLRMSEERVALLSALIFDIEMMLANKNGRSRGEIVKAIEHELKV